MSNDLATDGAAVAEAAAQLVVAVADAAEAASAELDAATDTDRRSLLGELKRELDAAAAEVSVASQRCPRIADLATRGTNPSQPLEELGSDAATRIAHQREREEH
jgi:hypothetical protein